MAKKLDSKDLESLKKAVGRRLRAARKAAAVTEKEAADAIGHKGLTQLSLAESGDRIPPTLTLLALADLYQVSIDYFLLRIDDPIAEIDEINQAVISRSIGRGIADVIGALTKTLGDQAAVIIGGHRRDRKDIGSLLDILADAEKALDRVKELNPEFEEDWRGSAALEAAFERAGIIRDDVKRRIDFERRQMDIIDKMIDLDKAESRIMQFSLELAT